jgi:hypothetical protein
VASCRGVVGPSGLNFRTVIGLALFGCSSPPPLQSPASVPNDVRVHQSEHRPKLVKLEREGDPRPALAAAVLHGFDTTTGHVWAKEVQRRLAAAGVEAKLRAFPTGLLVSITLGAAAKPVNPVTALRDALQAVPIKPVANPAGWDNCGMALNNTQVATTPGHSNIVLGAVGNKQALDRITTWYNTTAEWLPGAGPTIAWPETDAVRSEPAAGMGEIVVARRTPLRSRTVQAAYEVGDPDSTLGLIAHSFPGKWRVLEAHSNYMPGGACLTVRLQGQEKTTPTEAAHVARAVATELDWVLTEQTSDEDPRLTVLEGFTATDAAERAAWLSAVELVPLGKESTSFVHYRGPMSDIREFAQHFDGESKFSAIPVATSDEPGQGHVWAALVNRCALQQEDDGSAGHTWSVLHAVAESEPSRRALQATATAAHVGLTVSHTSRAPGAEDAVAETLGRGILRFHRDSTRVAELRAAVAARMHKVPTWSFALKLATGGHPSWLSGVPTEESLLALAPTSARRALELFVQGPLELKVLTSRGSAQAARMVRRLSHLLSGLRQRATPCLPPSSRLQQLPVSGEYWLQAPQGSPAVLLYLLDARFAPIVREVARLLRQPGGWLERSLPKTEFPTHVATSGLGSSATLSALAFTIAAENDEQLSRTVAQVRELIRRLTVGNLGQTARAEPNDEALPEQRLELLSNQGVDESALLNELLGRALPAATVVYVKPVQNN